MILSFGDVTSAAAELLGTPVPEAVRLPASHTNETWRVATAAGAVYVVKIGPAGYAAKWRSAHQALDLAAAAGVPVAPLVRSAVRGDRLVRAFGWVEGRPPEPGALGPEGVRRLFTDLGVALRALHGIERDGFTSRLDGSAPSFARWPDYLSVRIEAIAARCRATGALEESELARVLAAVERLMAHVGDEARPTLCHRDLYADNLLVEPNGRLAAILDFDTAEVWDHAGEFDKLDRLLIPAFPGARRWFDAAYWEGLPRPPHWDERVRLVALIEALNTLPNAISAGWETAFADDARARMRSMIELC
ncbi:phosphotransferase family protein [Actinospica robiniae]|uniref:phosphotransferase family protein n=1 Tax=Actinospica robiniae TaxID=304901 RepID=UPI00041C3A3D|nr:aminoglycoside phosphotransferase family protein [Actinospica robiniae]